MLYILSFVVILSFCGGLISSGVFKDTTYRWSLYFISLVTFITSLLSITLINVDQKNDALREKVLKQLIEEKNKAEFENMTEDQRIVVVRERLRML